MKSKIQFFSMAVLMSITWIACAPEPSTNSDTSAISGTYRKNNVAWAGSFGPCEVNQILTISRNGNDHANIIGSYEVITQPGSGLGAPVINYVGDYNLSNCTIAKTDDIITINYSYSDDLRVLRLCWRILSCWTNCSDLNTWLNLLTALIKSAGSIGFSKKSMALT